MNDPSKMVHRSTVIETLSEKGISIVDGHLNDFSILDNKI